MTCWFIVKPSSCVFNAIILGAGSGYSQNTPDMIKFHLQIIFLFIVHIDELPEPAVNVSLPDKKGLKDAGENCEKRVSQINQKRILMLCLIVCHH